MAFTRTATITILNGQTDSAALNLEGDASRRSFDATIIAPATLPESVTVEVLMADGSTWATLQSGGSDITLPAGKGTPLVGVVARSVRLHAGTAVAAQRDFDWIAVARA